MHCNASDVASLTGVLSRVSADEDTACLSLHSNVLASLGLQFRRAMQIPDTSSQRDRSGRIEAADSGIPLVRQAMCSPYGLRTSDYGTSVFVDDYGSGS